MRAGRKIHEGQNKTESRRILKKKNAPRQGHRNYTQQYNGSTATVASLFGTDWDEKCPTR